MGSVLITHSSGLRGQVVPLASPDPQFHHRSCRTDSLDHRCRLSRDLFPHWHIVSGTCDTREEMLKRDGTGVILAGEQKSFVKRT
ncbi:MAG: hypothetical protein QOH50_2900 [Kribbellaceae bacterium]|jgi:hypothetical protein|nr:hypothetical protein [Kribbellaceae bacterium]